MSEQATFECESCGKSYNWKPALAGKHAKCKCGATITVPQSVSAPEPAEEDLYDLVEDDALKPQRAPVAPVKPIAPPTSRGTGAGTPGVAPIARPGKGGAPSRLGAGMPAGIGPTKFSSAKHQMDPDQKKMLILGAAGVLLVALLIGGFVMLKGGGGSEAAMPFEDKMISEKLHDQANTEIKEFLGNQMFSVLGMTTSQAQGFADRLYGMGAKDVRAFDGRVSMTMVVELPEDSEQRKSIIDHYNRYHEGNQGVPKATDVGQRYLMYRLKIANV